MSESDDKYKMANLFEAVFPQFKRARSADITGQLVSLFGNRFQGVKLVSPDDSFHFDVVTKDMPVDLLRIEPRFYGDTERGCQRYAVIDFTHPVLWALIVARYRRLVIGKPATAKYGERDVYYPILREVAFSQSITLSRLELYGTVFTQEMLNHIASMPLKELVLEGVTYGADCRLVVNASLDALCLSVLGATPLRVAFPSAAKMLETLGFGGAKQYRHHGAAAGSEVDMALGDLYIVEGTPTIVIKNLLFLVSMLDVMVNSLDAFLSRFVSVDRVFVCTGWCGAYYPIYPNLTVVRDDFHPQASVPEDTNAHGVLMRTLRILDNHHIRHLGFDAEFVKTFLVGVDISVLMPYFCTIECEHVTVQGVKKYPLVFSDNSNVSVWTWGDIARDAARGTYATRRLPSLSKVNNFSFSVSPDVVFRKNFYIVVNRADSDVTLPNDVAQIELAVQSRNLIRPPEGILASIKKVFQ